MQFSKILKELRKEKNMTQTQLGHLIGFSYSAIRDWESSRTQPSIENLIKLARIFNVTVGQLVGVEDL